MKMLWSVAYFYCADKLPGDLVKMQVLIQQVWGGA